MRILPAFFLAILILPAVPAQAERAPLLDLIDAPVAFSAEYHVAAEGRGEYRGTVIHAPGRERREFATAQGRQILLIRRDTRQAAMLWPERKWYLSLPFEAASNIAGADIDAMTIERRNAVKETVAGEPCTRYDVTASGGDSSFSGRMWFTRDGILMKASGTAEAQGRRYKVDTALRNLLRIKADPQAFIIPSDYLGMQAKNLPR
ncbi:MAG: DUF4412 domain-containing protein [Rhodospirillaceae bacterium]|nr:DUF4412 domain-containing protein [Rhodospirillaceae bacterium]